MLDVRFVMLWEQIAAHFQGRNSRLVLELYNEPHGRLNGEPWNVLAARTLRVVRKTNPDRIVMIGPTRWNNASDLQLLKMPNDANLIATVHNYSPFPFTHQGAEWVSPMMPVGVTCCSAAQQAEMVAPLDVAKAWSAAKRYPDVRRRVRRVQQGRRRLAHRVQSHDASGDGESRHDLGVLGVRVGVRRVRSGEAQLPPAAAGFAARTVGPLTPRSPPSSAPAACTPPAVRESDAAALRPRGMRSGSSDA